MLRLAPVLVTIPFYWLLLSLAAWRALFQFLTAPYKWEKTEHGLARTSLHTVKRAPRTPRELHIRRPQPARTTHLRWF